jgi:hypothetical protein
MYQPTPERIRVQWAESQVGLVRRAFPPVFFRNNFVHLVLPSPGCFFRAGNRTKLENEVISSRPKNFVNLVNLAIWYCLPFSRFGIKLFAGQFWDYSKA